MNENYSSLPFGFSSFFEMMSYHYGPLIGMDRVENKMKAEISDIIAEQVAEFKKAESAADKIALELAIEEELEKVKKEQNKEKKERKTERKKRQRQRRKLMKQLPADTDVEQNNEDGVLEEDEKEEDRSEELDYNSAFVSNAAVRFTSNKQIPKIHTSPVDAYTNIKDKKQSDISVAATHDHPVTILAFKGFNFAKEGLLSEAIDTFSEALFLTAEDYRLYANRCLCYLQIREYQKALEDSKNCIKYAPDYSIGYLRMGEAYLGLNDFLSAEQAFEQVLRLDPNSQEAQNDLFFIQLKKLMDMGFSKKKASAAMQKMKTLNAAIEHLLHASTDLDDETDESLSTSHVEHTGGSEIFQSDGEEGEEPFTKDSPGRENNGGDDCGEAASVISSPVVGDNAKFNRDTMALKENPFMDYKNSYHCKRLYIGNVSSRITKKFLESTFSRFGKIVDVRMLPSSKCAFVTYEDWESAGEAMGKLQNWSLMPGTPPVVIKYPTTDLQKLAGSTISPIPGKPQFKSGCISRSASVCGERDDWCSQTMPPPSPAPSLSSVRSSYSQAVLHSPQKKTVHDSLKDPSNPNNCGSLYVGNLTQKVKERDILTLFSKYGQVISVRVIPEKKCAFVNFTCAKNAAFAMSSLQGRSVFPGFPPLVIKYPTKAVRTVDPRNSSASTGGQILGDECYNWRTLGCSLGIRCPNRHVPEHKGIALRHKAVRSFNF